MPPLARLLALGAVVAVAVLAGVVLLPRDPDTVREAVEGAGAWAPLAFVAATAALVLVFFPFPLIAGAAGLLFGIGAGTALALAGELIGACTAFLIARHAGGGALGRLAGPRLAAVLDGVARRGFAAVLVARVMPGLPRHPANYAFGLTAVGLGAFALATAIGAAPRTFAYAALGGSLDDLSSPEALAAVAVLVGVGALGLWLGARDPELRRALRAAGPGRRR